MYSLKNLLNNYAVTPTDKANVNPAFICQRFYALALVKELGVDEEAAASTAIMFQPLNLPITMLTIMKRFQRKNLTLP